MQLRVIMEGHYTLEVSHYRNESTTVDKLQLTAKMWDGYFSQNNTCDLQKCLQN